MNPGSELFTCALMSQESPRVSVSPSLSVSNPPSFFSDAKSFTPHNWELAHGVQFSGTKVRSLLACGDVISIRSTDPEASMSGLVCVMIQVGTNNISRSSDEEEALWESMMVCLHTILWQKFNCAVLTVCTVPMNARSLTAAGRRHNEGVVRWNNILRNLASRNAGRMILMDIEHELRAMDQARLTTDGIHFDSIEGQAWLNKVFQERLDELEAEILNRSAEGRRNIE